MCALRNSIMGTTRRPDITRQVLYYMTVGLLNLSRSHLTFWVSCTRWEEATELPYPRLCHLFTKVIITDAGGMAQWSASRGPELKSQHPHCGPQTPVTSTSKNPIASGLKTPAHVYTGTHRHKNLEVQNIITIF